MLSSAWRQKILLVTVLAFVGMVIAVGGCAPRDSTDTAESASGVVAANYQAGSLLASASHNGVLSEESVVSRAECKSCHSLSSLADAETDKFYDSRRDANINPHNSPHDTTNCENCHSLKGQSVFICNNSTCHAATDVPEGWAEWSEEKQVAEN
jgi:hypothetical protein